MTITTESRIVDAALTLFNERGTDSVTTNHIAAETDLNGMARAAGFRGVSISPIIQFPASIVTFNG